MFEVGKQYRSRTTYKIATCLFVVPNGEALIQWPDGSCGLYVADQRFWEEVPPPLKFADLKVGEKFRWKIARDSGNNVCMKISPFDASAKEKVKWVYLEGQEVGTAWADHGIADNHVVRVA